MKSDPQRGIIGPAVAEAADFRTDRFSDEKKIREGTCPAQVFQSFQEQHRTSPEPPHTDPALGPVDIAMRARGRCPVLHRVPER